MVNFKMKCGLIFFLLTLCTVSSFAQLSGDYWRQDDNSSNIWVNISSIAPGENVTFYIQNSSGIISNGSNVFPFFDDFEDGVQDTDKWEISASGASTSGCTYTESSGILTFDDTSSLNNLCYLSSPAKWGYGYVFQGRMGLAGPATGSDTYSFRGSGIGLNTINSSTTARNDVFPNTGTYTALWANQAGSGDFYVTYNTTDTIKSISQSINEKMFYMSANESKYYSGGTLIDIQTSNIINTLMGPYFYSSLQTSSASSVRTYVNADWVFMRKFVETEPTVDTFIDGDIMVVVVTNNHNETIEGYNVKVEDSFGGNLTISNTLPATWISTNATINLSIGDVYYEVLSFDNPLLVNVSVSSDGNAVLVLDYDTSSVNLTYNATSVGFFKENFSLNSSFEDNITYTFNVTLPPTWISELINTTQNKSTNVYTVSFNSSYDSFVTVNDTHFSIVTDNLTQQANITFIPDTGPGTDYYYVTFLVNNSDGNDSFQTVFEVYNEPYLEQLQFNNTNYYSFQDILVSSVLNIEPDRLNGNVIGTFYVNGVAPIGTYNLSGVNSTTLNFTLNRSSYLELETVTFNVTIFDLFGVGMNSSYSLSTIILNDTMCSDGIDNDADSVYDLSDADCTDYFDNTEYGSLDSSITTPSRFTFERATIDLSNAKCNLVLNPDSVIMVDNRVIQINLTNNEQLSYTPQISIRGDDSAVKSLKVIGDFGTVLRGSTSSISVKYSSSLLGIPIFPFMGKAEVVLSHDRCNEVVIPIEMAIQGLVETQQSLQGGDLGLVIITNESDLSWADKILDYVGFQQSAQGQITTEEGSSFLSREVHESTSFVKNWMLFSLMAILFGIYFIDKNYFKNEFLNILFLIVLWVGLTVISSIGILALIRLLWGTA